MFQKTIFCLFFALPAAITLGGAALLKLLSWLDGYPIIGDEPPQNAIKIAESEK